MKFHKEFLLFIFLPVTGFIFGNYLVLEPLNPYVFIGENLELSCEFTNNESAENVSSLMYIVTIRGNVSQEYVHVTGPRSVKMVYPVTSSEDGGMYSCILNTAGKEFLAAQTVTVEYPPTPVQDVRCVVDNWKKMDCQWDKQEVIKNKSLTYGLYWTVSGEQVFECPHFDDETMTCTWLNVDLHNVSDSLMLKATYFIYINASISSSTGEIQREVQSHTFEVYPDHLVKPGPVENLTVGNKTSNCLYVSWRFKPQSHATMEYVVQFTSRGQIQNLTTNDDYYMICDLRPATVYNISIKGKAIPYMEREPAGFFSDVRFVESKTLDDVPVGVPGVVQGGFRFHAENQPTDCADSSLVCNVTVYWKGLSEEESQGELTDFIVELTDLSSNRVKTETTDGSARAVDFTVNKNNEYRVVLMAATSAGVSEMNSSIVIPKLEEKPSFQTNFVVESDDKEVHLTWDPADDPEVKYTTYVCRGSMTSLRCSSEISWNQVTNQSVIILNAADGNLFGISSDRNTSAGAISSGIKWSQCTYIRNAAPSAPVIESVVNGENSLRAEWTMPGCDLPYAYVDSYILSYCISQDRTSCSGDRNEVKISRKGNGNKLSYTMHDLTWQKYYVLTLRAVSRGRESDESEPIVKQVTNSDLTSAQIVGISLGVLFGTVVFIGFVFCCARFCKRKWNSKYAVAVPNMPNYGPYMEGKDLLDGMSVNGENKESSAEIQNSKNDLLKHLVNGGSFSKSNVRTLSESSDKSGENTGSYFWVGKSLSGSLSGLSEDDSEQISCHTNPAFSPSLDRQIQVFAVQLGEEPTHLNGKESVTGVEDVVAGDSGNRQETSTDPDEDSDMPGSASISEVNAVANMTTPGLEAESQITPNKGAADSVNLNEITFECNQFGYTLRPGYPNASATAFGLKDEFSDDLHLKYEALDSEDLDISDEHGMDAALPFQCPHLEDHSDDLGITSPLAITSFEGRGVLLPSGSNESNRLSEDQSHDLDTTAHGHALAFSSRHVSLSNVNHESTSVGSVDSHLSASANIDDVSAPVNCLKDSSALKLVPNDKSDPAVLVDNLGYVEKPSQISELKEDLNDSSAIKVSGDNSSQTAKNTDLLNQLINSAFPARDFTPGGDLSYVHLSTDGFDSCETSTFEPYDLSLKENKDLVADVQAQIPSARNNSSDEPPQDDGGQESVEANDTSFLAPIEGTISSMVPVLKSSSDSDIQLPLLTVPLSTVPEESSMRIPLASTASTTSEVSEASDALSPDIRPGPIQRSVSSDSGIVIDWKKTKSPRSHLEAANEISESSTDSSPDNGTEFDFCNNGFSIGQDVVFAPSDNGYVTRTKLVPQIESR